MLCLLMRGLVSGHARQHCAKRFRAREHYVRTSCRAAAAWTHTPLHLDVLCCLRPHHSDLNSPRHCCPGCSSAAVLLAPLRKVSPCPRAAAALLRRPACRGRRGADAARRTARDGGAQARGRAAWRQAHGRSGEDGVACFRRA
jgi:hypothetical protein